MTLPPLWVRVVAYLLCVVLTDGPIAYAMPQGGRITSGSGSIGVKGNTMTIRQKTSTLSINWNSFNISHNQTVSFLQPGASSIALNQIGGLSPSYIYGHLLANGQIFLINPSGIVFGKGAQVNVGGLIASTLDLVNRGFSNSGTLSFSGASPGSITNNGLLKALPGGYIALLGQNVTNNGTVEAPRGAVTFGAGNRIDLDFNGGSLVSLAVTQNTLDSITANGGLVRAEGGKILLSAGAQDSIVRSVVNNTGVLEAQTVAQKNGEIVLLSGLASGTTNVAGTLDASAPSGGNGGTIETSGSRVNVADNAVVTTKATSGRTGTWTLDPASFYIGANTGSASTTAGQVTNYQDISGSELGTLLGLNNVVIDSTQGREGQLGNIYLNQAVSWSNSNQLTLNAVNNIEINAPITNTASGYSLTQSALTTPSALPSTPLLILRADDMDLGGTTSNGTGGGVPSGNGTVAVNSGGSISVNGPVAIYYNPTNYATPTGYTNNAGSSGSLAAYMLISSLSDLNYLSQNQNSTLLSNNYALNSNLSYPTNNTTSFTPLGNSTTSYTGYFNGLDHSISNLYENYSGNSAYDGGFIGSLGTSGWLRNLTLSGMNETINTSSGQILTGAVVGDNYGTVENVTATGSVTGSTSSTSNSTYFWVGGLTGRNSGTIASSNIDVNIFLTSAASQNNNVGGVVGQNQFNGSTNFAGLITGSVAEGNVLNINGASIGGFAGASNGGSTGATIQDSYATGSVTGTSTNSNFGSGGFVGVLLSNNTISNSYSLGTVSGYGTEGSPTPAPAGGFIGNVQGGSTNALSNNAWNTGAFVANAGAPVSGGIGIVQNGASYSTVNQVVPQSLTNLETPSVMAGLGTISTSPLVAKSAILANANTTTSSYTTVTTETASPNTWVMVNPNGTLASSSQSSLAATTPMLASEYSSNIATLHQLELMNLAPTASYTLLQSLDAAATGASGGDVFGSQGFVRVGSASTPFTGTFNGQGKVISNLTIQDATNGHVGLFGVLAGGKVENLTLANASIMSTGTSPTNTGGIAGENNGGTISGVSVTGTVEGSSNTSTLTGGISGYNTGTIEDAWSGGTVAGTGGNGYAGGITGSNGSGATVEDSYFTGILGGGATMGGIAGQNAGTITTTYAAGVEGYNGMNNGALVGGNVSGGVLENSYYDAGLFPNAYGSNSGTATNVTALLPFQMTQTGNFGSFVFSTTPGASGNAWVIVDTNGSLNNAGGTNGSLLPMLDSEAQSQIGTVHQLELMNMNLAGNYSLAASLNGDVTGATGQGIDVFGSQGFVRVGGGSYSSPDPFTGTFNGNNRSISNLSINDASNLSVGLFGNINNATIENLLLLDPNIQSSNPVNKGYNGERVLMGAVAGNMGGSSTISNVGVEGGTVQIANGQNQAGIVLGGVVGNAGSGTLDNVYETAAVSGTSPSSTGAGGNNINVGGIVANTGSSLVLDNVYATGKITESGTGEYTGGILGADNGVTVTNVYYSGVVASSPTSGTSASGGTGALWGNGSGTTTDVYWNSTLTSIGAGNGGSGGTGLSASQMATGSSFSGFNFTSTPGLSGNNWVLVDQNSSLNNASGAAGATTPMLASEYSQKIRTLHQLELMNMLPQSSYQLMNNIDASPTQSSSSYATSGDGGDVFGSSGFVRVGGTAIPFSGSFNGNGYAISHLSITDSTNVNVGLFGKAVNSTIENLILETPSVTSTVTSASQTSNPYAIGSVAGWLDGGSLSNVGVVWGSVTSEIGGGSVSGILLGELGNGSSGTVTNSYVDHGTLTFSSTQGNSSDYNSGNSWGGLIAGYNNGGTVENAYSTGNLILGNAGSGGNSMSMGGIVGLQRSGSIANTWDSVTLEDGSSATGGGGPAGLLVGNFAGGSIANAWGEGASTNVVNGTSYNIDTNADGYGNGTLGSSSVTVGSNVGIPASGLVSSDYTGLNFTTTPGLAGNNWVMVDSNGSLNNASGASGATGPMLSSEYARSIETVHQLELMNMNPGVAYTLNGTIDATATSSANQRLFAAGTFVRVGGSAAPFTGILDGNAQSINALTINDSTNTNVGLIGELAGSGVVANVAMGNPTGNVSADWASVTGGKSSAGQNLAVLVGYNNGGTIAESNILGAVTGTSTATQQIGTLAGESSGLIMGVNVPGGTQVEKTLSSDSGGDSIGGVVGYTLNNALLFGVTTNTGVDVSYGGTTPTGGISSNSGDVVGVGNGGVPTNQAGVYAYGVSSSYNPVGIVDSQGNGGFVTGWEGQIGGLVGSTQDSIANSSSSASVTGSGGALLGGLVGSAWWGLEILGSHATGNVQTAGTNTGGSLGGLVGNFQGSSSSNALIQNSYAGGTVNGNNYASAVGGLVGADLSGTTISSSYWGTNANAGGTVENGTSATGGLVGSNPGTLTNSEVGLDYGVHVNATSGSVGGLVGTNAGTVSDSYANAAMSTSGATAGGLVGTNTGTLTSSFYNTSFSSGSIPTSAVGSNSGTVTDAQGMVAGDFASQANFTSATSANGNTNPNWNFSTVWIQGQNVPLLLGILPQEQVTASNASQTYSGSSSTNGAVITSSGWSGSTPANLATGTLAYSLGSGAPNAGSYAITPSGLSVNASGYTTMHSGVGSVVYQNGTLLITPAPLTVTLTSPTKVYDASASGTLTSGELSISGWVGSDGATVNTGGTAPTVTYAPTSGATATPSVGTANVSNFLTATAAIGDSNLTPTGATNLSNYTLPSSVSVNTGSITPAPLSLSTTLLKIYDGTQNAVLAASNTALTGEVPGQTSGAALGSAGATGTLNSSNVGSNLGGTVSLTSSNLTGNTAFTSALSAGDYTLPASFTGGTITPAPLTVTVTNPTKTYDGTTLAYLTGPSSDSISVNGISQTIAANNTSITGFVGSQGATFNGATGTYASSNAGSGQSIAIALSAGDFTAGSGTTLSNYSINGVQLTSTNSASLSGVTGTINTAPISVTLTPTKLYDGTSNAYLTSSGTTETTNGITQTISSNVTLSGFVTGQGALLSATGTYSGGNSPHVGSGYTVSSSSETLTPTSGTTLSNYNIGGTTLASGSNSLTISGTGSITPAPLTVTLSSPSKTYDGTSTAYLTTASESVTTNGITQTISPNLTLSGFATGQGGTLTTTGSYSGGSSPNVGTGYSVVVSGLSAANLTSLTGGATASDYAIPVTSASGTGSITPAPLTVTLTPSKTYDGTTSATLSSSNSSVSGLVTGQTISLASGSGAYASANAGSGIGVTANLGPSNFTAGTGTSLSNYMISGTPLTGSNTATVTGLGTISRANLTATGTQIYNGTTTFSASNLTVAGVDGQTFTATGSGTLGSSGNVQSNQPLASVSGLSLTGNGGASPSNYNPLSTSQTQVTVSPDPILVSGTMVYNGTTVIPGSDLHAQAYLSSSNTSYNFSLTGTGTLGSSGNVQTNQNLASLGSLALSGSGSSNFTPTLAETSVSVTPAPLTVTLSNPTKTYDGTTTANLTSSNTTVTGFVSGQGATFEGVTGSYATPNAGSNINVAADLGAANFNPGTGTLLSNYQINGVELSGSNAATVSGTGTIGQAPLSATGTQVYNGTTSFSGANLTVTGGVDGQSFTASGSGTLANSGNVQTNQSLGSIAGLTIAGVGGANIANYTFSSANTSVSVTPAPLTVSLNNPTKSYDGTTTALLTSANTSVTGFVNGQGATFNGASGSYASANAGSGIGVTTGITPSDLTAATGTTLSNYEINAVPLSGSNTATVTGSGTISRANLTATGTQIYNGTTTFSASNLTVAGVDGQTFTATGSGTLGSSGNVQSNQPLASVSGLSLTGNGGALTSNYNPLSTSQTQVTVTSAPILISGTMVYNGTTNIAGSDLSAQGYLSGGSYSFTLTGTGTLANSGNVQTNQNLASLGTLALSGAGASNFTPTVSETSVSVTPAPLTVTLNNPTKTYDGTTTANLTSSNTTVAGFVSGQGATFNGAIGSYASANAGSSINVTGGITEADLTANSGTTLSNYQINGVELSGSNAATVSGTGTIGQALLSATGTQVYNGTTSFSGSNLTVTGGVDGQSFTASGSGTLGASGNVQSNQPLTSISGLMLNGVSGANPANYSLQTTNTSVSVTPAPLTLTLSSSPVNKTYDETSNAYLTSGSESLIVNGMTQSVSPNVTVSGFVSGQGGSFSATGSYSGLGVPNVGTGYLLSASGLGMGDFTAASGTNLGNYSLSTTSLSGTGNITAAPVTVTGLVANSKVYDATTVATLSSAGSLSGLLTGQSLTLTGPTSISFSTPNVGTGLVVTASGYSIGNGTGGLASNYLLTSSQPQTTANITPASLTLSTTASKSYDGTASLSLSGSDSSFSGFVAGQSGTLGTTVTGTLASANVGSNLGGSVSLTTSNLTGSSAFTSALSAGDYTLPTTFTGGSVTPATLTLSTTASKVYDGTSALSLSSSDASLGGIVSGQSGTLGTTVTGTLASASVGSNIGGSVSLTTSNLTGNSAFTGALSAGDYILPSTFTGGSVTGAVGTTPQIQQTYGSNTTVTQTTASTAQSAQTSAQASASSGTTSTTSGGTGSSGSTTSGLSLASSSGSGATGATGSGSSTSSGAPQGSSSVVDTSGPQFSGLVSPPSSGSSGGGSGSQSTAVSSLALTTGSLSFSVVGGGVSSGSSTVSIQGGGVSGGSSSGSSSLSIQSGGVSGGSTSGSSSLSVTGSGVSGGTSGGSTTTDGTSGTTSSSSGSSGSSSLSVQGGGVSGGSTSGSSSLSVTGGGVSGGTTSGTTSSGTP